MRCNADPRITVAIAKELGYYTNCNECENDNIEDEMENSHDEKKKNFEFEYSFVSNAKVSQERIDELNKYFWDESNDEDTQEWRDGLTAEERELVKEWDGDYTRAIGQVVKDTAALMKK